MKLVNFLMSPLLILMLSTTSNPITLANKNDTLVDSKEDMKNITITINRLKIVDCADDDEDMDLRLSIYVTSNGVERRVFNRELIDVYVEEEGKVGNESRCTFFGGEQVANLANVTSVRINVDLSTRDGDGMNWGGHHYHTQETSTLRGGTNDFVQTKVQSSNPGSGGEYQLSYTLTVL